MEPSASLDVMDCPETTVLMDYIIHKLKSQLALIEVLVCLTFFLLMIQFPIVLLRQRYTSGSFKFIACVVYSTVNLLIPYIFGLLFSLRHNGLILVFTRAMFLLIAYMNVSSVLDPNDPLPTESLFLKILIYLTYTLLLVRDVGLLLSIIPLSVLALCLSYKIVAWRNLKTVKFDGGKRLNIKCMTPFKYLTDSTDDEDGDQFEISSESDDILRRCNYVVDPLSIQVKDGNVVDRGITIQKIWSSEQGLLQHQNHVHEVKKTCLSFSLFWLLLHKFSGLPLYESTHEEKAWRVVRHGLIDDASGHRFAFGVIEVELAFLCDILYGNHFELYLPGYMAYLMNQFLFLLVIGINMVYAYLIHKYLVPIGVIDLQYHSLDINFLVSGVVITTITLLQFAQTVFVCKSRWAKMSLLCTYFKQRLLDRPSLWNRCIKKAAEFLCPSRGERLKPWQRKLGQYSFVKSCTCRRNFLWRGSSAFMAITGVQIGRPGRKESTGIILSDVIMVAVIEMLKARGRYLSNGITSLESSGLSQETIRNFAWACTQLDTDAQVILVWHIATSVCEIHPHLTSGDRETDNFHVATSLSRYCAYLVVFAPNLLPGLPAVTDSTCTEAIENAYTLLKDCESSNIYARLMEISEVEQRNMPPIIHQGAFLGKLLLTLESADLWKVLAHVWSEMILYLAPNSSNEWSHAERLADGGEFITHLWALLFHAGIVDRDSLRGNASVGR